MSGVRNGNSGEYSNWRISRAFKTWLVYRCFVSFWGRVVGWSPHLQFTNIVFDDGTLVAGSFVFDADTTTFSGLNMTTSGGISVPATSSWVFNINNLPGTGQNAGGITGFEAVDALSGDETGAHLLSLFSTLGPLMTDAGGTITLNFFVAGTCLDAACADFNSDDRHSNSGQGEFTSETSTPEPSTLILGGSALILAGLRRKLFARG